MIMTTDQLALSLHRCWRGLGSFVRDRKGASIVELALATPILMLILLGTFDMAQYVLLNQKLNRAASAMADLVSQSPNITAAQVDQLFSAAQRLVEPFDLPVNGRVIVSSISRATGASARIDWQREGGGSLSASSNLGIANSMPTLPTTLSVREGENLIAAEVYYTHEPYLLSGLLPAGVIRHEAYRRARLGTLSTLN